MANFAVTGGAGFIGSHLAKSLVKNDHNVIVIDNLHRGTLSNLKEIQNEIEFHEIDIRDYNNMYKVLKNIDGIFHQAALNSVPESFKNSEEYYQVNTIGTENILKLAKKFSFKVVYASSASIYGNQTKFPIHEDAEKKPSSPYGDSKFQAEKLATKFAEHGVSVIGLRYFNVFGVGENPNYAGVISKFIENLTKHKSPIINGDGSQLRNFVFVDDVVKANILALKSNVVHAFINIASNNTTSINELAKIMIRMSGLSIKPVYDKPRKGDIEKSQADISLAKKLIGWEPKTTLEQGLEKIFPKI